MTRKISILSTALLHEQQPDMGDGILLDVIPFIKTEPATDSGVARTIIELALVPVTVIFTSANAVYAVAEILHGIRPLWTIYCIGNATKHAVLEKLDRALISGTATDAATLATIITGSHIREVVFFCGDKRLDVLPSLLHLEGTTVQEIIVYTTTRTPEIVRKKYEGVLFFSPSGVESFFSVNTVGGDSVLFAIGHTTEKALKQKTNNTVVVAAVPSKEQLLLQAVQYLTTMQPAG